MRAVLAVFCFVLFYVVSAAMAVGLVWLGYQMLTLLDGIRSGQGMIAIVLLAVGCLVAAAVVVWSVLPRVDRFEPPGPELSPQQHPALFAVIRDVAARTNQATPTHVYAVLDANAFVSQRGGVMGFGSKRVMGVGLALMQAFSIAELRGVLAHEFGHFYGGDTRLGPWIYKTRGAMVRTLENLGKAAEAVKQSGAMVLVMTTVAKPFRWMTIGYLRISQTVSRQQEYSADRVAARVEGSAPLLSGFAKLPSVSVATNSFIQSDLEALVNEGVAPPVIDGLFAFAAAHQGALDQVNVDALKIGAADPYDSHPPLSERIRVLQALNVPVPNSSDGDGASSLTLLHDPEAVAQAILQHAVGKPLQRVTWEQSGATLAAGYRKHLQKFRPFFETATVLDIRNEFNTFARMWEHSPEVSPVIRQLPDKVVQQISRTLLFNAFAVALVDAGWHVTNQPGKPLQFTRNEQTLELGVALNDYFDGKMSATEWQAFWETAGLPTTPWATLRRAPGDADARW